MGQVFAHPSIQLAGGLDLGILMATCGLVYGIVSGIAWINLAARIGWINRRREGLSESRRQSDTGLPIGYATVSSETIDPLLLQVIWLALAFGVGLGLQLAVGQLVGLTENLFSGTAGVAASGEGAVVPALDPSKRGREFPSFHLHLVWRTHRPSCLARPGI